MIPIYNFYFFHVILPSLLFTLFLYQYYFSRSQVVDAANVGTALRVVAVSLGLVSIQRPIVFASQQLFAYSLIFVT